MLRPISCTEWHYQRSLRGFTLIELMIVAAIIGILATLAIPSFFRLQLKSRRAEVFINIKDIAVSELAFDHANDRFVECKSSPTTPLNKKAYAFDSTQPGWAELEWQPDGEVRCHYSADIITTAGRDWVKVWGRCDLDDDNKTASYYTDVDPFQVSPSSDHLALQSDSVTVANNRY